MGKKEELVVTIKLGHLNNICNSRGVRLIPERDARDSIERFDLGEYLFYINVLGKISRLLLIINLKRRRNHESNSRDRVRNVYRKG